MKTVFFTLVEDIYRYGAKGKYDPLLHAAANATNPRGSREIPGYPHLEYELFERSFKFFHPDIELVTLGTKEIRSIQKSVPSATLYNMKATAAKLFYDDYDLVVNIDADHFIFDRLEEILEADYDVAGPSNNNLLVTMPPTTITQGGHSFDLLSDREYIQGGLIASTSKEFWDTYEYFSLRHAERFLCKENDILNFLIKMGPFKFKLLDGGYDLPNVKSTDVEISSDGINIIDPSPDVDYESPTISLNAAALSSTCQRTCFYGCSSLGLEEEAMVKDDKLTIRGLPVKAYHVARGEVKPTFRELFTSEVSEWWYSKVTEADQQEMKRFYDSVWNESVPGWA